MLNRRQRQMCIRDRVPDPFTTAWPDTIERSQDLITAAGDVIEGLRAPDDGSQRREAVRAYNEQATPAFLDQLDVVRALTP